MSNRIYINNDWVFTEKFTSKFLSEDVKDALKATFKNPKESAYMVRFAAASKKASQIRAKSEKEGMHIPPFLIASITSNCNLHCAGCYSRSNNATQDCAAHDQLTSDEWGCFFDEAEELGVSFILLAGGSHAADNENHNQEQSFKLSHFCHPPFFRAVIDLPCIRIAQRRFAVNQGSYRLGSK